MKALIVTASLAMLSALASTAPLQSTGAPPVMTDIRWDMLPPEGSREIDNPRLHIRSDRSSSTLALDGSRPETAAAQRALAGAAGPVAFAVTHEAGTLACDGRLSRRYEGGGGCRFAAAPGFEQALAKHGIRPGNRSDLLAMLLVNATIELADGLSRAGLPPQDADELVAAAALRVTPAYVRDLRAAPMKLTSLDDVFACRALGINAAYVRELAGAGYTDLSLEDVISMKALGVTGDYARRMNAAAAELSQ